LLFPIDWPEPFGLVMIEAMACGTPVVAFPCGSAPEIIQDGVSGCLVQSIEEGVARLPQTMGLNRRTVRQAFEKRFSAKRMATDYVATYRTILGVANAEQLAIGMGAAARERVNPTGTVVTVRPNLWNPKSRELRIGERAAE
jgi:glycogen synthase